MEEVVAAVVQVVHLEPDLVIRSELKFLKQVPKKTFIYVPSFIFLDGQMHIMFLTRC